jgi:predicted component of type VI protein secretion system
MATKEQRTGVEVITEGIKDLVPEALPQKYLIADNFSGNGGSDVLDKIEDPKYKHANASPCPTLQEAFDTFRPSLRVDVPKAADPKDTTAFNIRFRGLEDFDADKLVRRTPELQSLDEMERGYQLLLKFLGTKTGRKWVEKLATDGAYFTAQKALSEEFARWLSELNRVLEEQREGTSGQEGKK